MTRPRVEPTTRFWAKVDKRGPDECWMWTGAKDSGGYGTFRVNRPWLGMTRAHVFSYLIHHGEIQHAMEVLHSCDKPLCVNPAHLSQNTHAANMADASAKGRLHCGINWEGHNANRAKQGF